MGVRDRETDRQRDNETDTETNKAKLGDRNIYNYNNLTTGASVANLIFKEFYTLISSAEKHGIQTKQNKNSSSNPSLSTCQNTAFFAKSAIDHINSQTRFLSLQCPLMLVLGA